jgi:hypothetical protein
MDTGEIKKRYQRIVEVMKREVLEKSETDERPSGNIDDKRAAGSQQETL